MGTPVFLSSFKVSYASIGSKLKRKIRYHKSFNKAAWRGNVRIFPCLKIKNMINILMQNTTTKIINYVGTETSAHMSHVIQCKNSGC